MKKKKKIDNPIKPLYDKWIQLKRIEMGEVPLAILNTMDILYADKENRPLLIKDGVKQYSGGWHFVFTLNPGCNYEEVESKKGYFQSVVDGKVEMKLVKKFLHINVSDFEFEDSYSFDIITPEIADKYRKWYLPIPIGIKAGGKLLFVNMEEFSHLMVGGVNNSGKSTWIRQLIMFVKKYRPEVKIVYIDFMRLDARPFKDLVYLGRTINEAHQLLQLTCLEADRRLDILEEANCFKASEYKGREKINPLLVIIDELAELEDKDSQVMINHLARTARKCGVHLITSLQRPSHTTYKNFTDSRSQFPARLSFKMAEKIDSEIILGKGNTKAYELEAKGRAIWQYNKEHEIQSLNIENHELLRMIKEFKGEGGDFIYAQEQNLWLQPR